MTTRSQTAQTRRPNVVRPPGIIGESSASQGYPTDDRGTHVTKGKNKLNKKMYKKFIVFHLSNRDANRKLNLIVHGTKLMNDDAPKYLGIKLDRTLTFNQYLEDVKNKLKTRNNIISKLAATSWGCQANVLRISALALVYSVAEYCAPVWERSEHAKKVDTQLNNTMRIITGCVRVTNLQ